MPENNDTQAADPQNELEQLRAQVAKLQSDKDFLLADTNGLREVNSQLQTDLEAAVNDRIAQIIAFRDEVGQALLGVPSVTTLLQDYSRVGDLLIRSGKIPPDTKTGEMYQALMQAELAAMKERGEVTDAPVEGAPVPNPATEASLADAPVASPVAPPLPPPSPEPAAPAPPAPAVAPMTPATGPGSGPTVKTIEPPAGGWMAQPKLG